MVFKRQRQANLASGDAGLAAPASGFRSVQNHAIVVFLVLLLLFSAPGPGPGFLFAQNASVYGYSGLMLVPSAEVSGDGQLACGISRTPELYANWRRLRRTVFWARIGFLPFLEAGGMFVRPDHYVNAGFGDRSLYLRLQLLRERGRGPAVAVGAQDFFSLKGIHWATSTKQHFGAVYLVASKRVTLKKMPLQLHLGYGPDWTVAKTKLLVGPFGGLQLTPHRWASLLAEYDAKSFNAGFRLHPFHFVQLQYIWWRLRAPCITAAVLLPLK